MDNKKLLAVANPSKGGDAKLLDLYVLRDHGGRAARNGSPASFHLGSGSPRGAGEWGCSRRGGPCRGGRRTLRGYSHEAERSTSLKTRSVSHRRRAGSPAGHSSDTDVRQLAASSHKRQRRLLPGDFVTLTGSGWGTEESVHIFVNDNDGQTWTYSAGLVADADGSFTCGFQLPTTFIALYRVTATGSPSGVSTTSFTDGNVRYALANAD